MRKRSFAAFVAAVLLVAVAVTGCGGSAQQPAAKKEEPKPAPKAAGTPPNTLVIGARSVIQLDPQQCQDDPSYYVISQIFNSLVRTGKNNTPIPDLAESWTNPDDKTWVFKIRKGVMWHDDNEVFPKGKSRPVTAHDVKYTYDRILSGSKEIAPIWAKALESVQKIEVVDDYTLKITTKYPDPFLLGVIQLAGIGIVPREAIEKLGPEKFKMKPVGSGPFKFVEFVPDSHVTLVRNENYFIKPKLEKVIFKIIPDTNVALVALEAGEIDLTLELPPKDVERISQDPRFNAVRGTLGGYQGLIFNMKRDFFKDVRVRKAISMAIDIDKIAKSVFGVTAERAYGQVGPGIPGHDPTLKDLWEFNPEKAKKLLADAGWTKGPDGILQKGGKKFSFEITCAQNKPREAALVSTIAYLKEIGIEAKPKVLEFGTYIAENTAGKFDAILFSGYSGETGLFSLFHSKNIPNPNYASYSNKQVDAWLDEAMKTLDRKKFEELWKKAQRQIISEWPHVPYYHVFTYYGVSKKVKDFVPPRFNLNLVSVESNCYKEQ